MNAIALVRPRLIPLLTIGAGVLLAVYIALMVTTILFASLQTQLAQSVQEERMAIAKLEATYYDSVADLNATDPHTLGYVTPTRVQYVSETQVPGVAFAK